MVSVSHFAVSVCALGRLMTAGLKVDSKHSYLDGDSRPASTDREIKVPSYLPTRHGSFTMGKMKQCGNSIMLLFFNLCTITIYLPPLFFGSLSHSGCLVAYLIVFLKNVKPSLMNSWKILSCLSFKIV